MKVIRHDINYKSHLAVIKIKPLYDLHIGALFCNEEKIKEDVAAVLADPLAFAIIGGDVCEFINRSDKRHKEEGMAKWLHGHGDVAQVQIERAIKLLSPLTKKNKVLAVMMGNHEENILKKYERDVYAELVRNLRRSDGVHIGLGYAGWLQLNMKEMSRSATSVNKKIASKLWCIDVWLSHGYGGGILEGGHALTLGRVFKSYNADLVLMGHRHVFASIRNLQISLSPYGKVQDRMQVGAFCGSYRKSYIQDNSVVAPSASYEQMKGYPPQECGSPWILITPHTHEICVR
jgi:hypothetical protein